jgi:hypothetical protein
MATVRLRSWTTSKGVRKSAWLVDHHANHHRSTRQFKTKEAADDWLAVVQASEGRLLIWSEEHGAWWKPGRIGYTRSIREAGRYSFDEAAEIVDTANRYLKSGFNEIAMIDPMLPGEGSG